MTDLLGETAAEPHRGFWVAPFSMLEFGVLRREKLLAGRHSTDVHPLALTCRNTGRLVTLDKGISLRAIP